MVRFRHALHVCDSTCVQSEDKKKSPAHGSGEQRSHRSKPFSDGGDSEGNAMIKACVDFTTDLRTGKS